MAGDRGPEALVRRTGGPGDDDGEPAAGDEGRPRPQPSPPAAAYAVAGPAMAGGWAVARAAKGIVEHTGLNAGLVGAVLMGLVNALPETVTAIAAVRRGAVTPAVAAVIGGDGRDALDLVVGDAAYRGGSLFHAANPDERWTSGSSPAARWSWRRSCSAVSSSAGGAAG